MTDSPLTRRHVLATGTAVATWSILPNVTGAAEAPPKTTDWPSARGDAKGTGVARTKLPGKPTVVWSYHAEESNFEGTPAIVDGVVYLGDAPSGKEGNVYAFDLATGDVKWTFDKGKLGYVGSPSVADGRVYLGDGDGVFRGFDAKTGKELWTVQMDGEVVAGTNPLDGRVLVGCQDSNLYLVDGATGDVKWKTQIGNQIRAFPTVSDGKAFACQCDGTMHVFDVATGKIENSLPLGPPGMPAQNQFSAPAVWKHLLIFGTESGEAMGLDWKKANIEWTYQPEGASQPIHSSPAIADDVVVIAGRGKFVAAIDPATGKEKWRFATKNAVESSPVIAGDRVFVGAVDGRLYSIGLADGKGFEVHQGNGGYKGGPAVADGRLVIATERGWVYCFGTK